MAAKCSTRANDSPRYRMSEPSNIAAAVSTTVSTTTDKLDEIDHYLVGKRISRSKFLIDCALAYIRGEVPTPDQESKA